ncbi:IclR family transcriptional regulator [Arthrobacter sedimenti]|uniref:IclR family transcriptional regulator n=1 Tax=Arthrobacter sedimenti TaxID=2694931 RepID=UPI000B357689|nr:IclR family transcriptional regulator [Arthrobacter sedimenti]OUM45644.1 IclR family transcriptional regulator [Arthrobacter agilis]
MANSPSGDSVVDRIVRVFASFPTGSGWLPLAELARRANLPQATAFRLVRQLARHGLLEISCEGSVRVGLRLWEVATRNSPTVALRDAALPFMEDVQQILNQNVNLAILEGWDVLFVERLSRRGSVENRANVAGRMPVHVSSAGLALMSYQPKNIQADYLSELEETPGYPSSEQFRGLLAEVALRGYAQLAGVVDPCTQGIAVPVADCSGRTVAALGVVVPLTELRLQSIVPVLQTAARGVGRQLSDAQRNDPSMEWIRRNRASPAMPAVRSYQ